MWRLQSASYSWPTVQNPKKQIFIKLNGQNQQTDLKNNFKLFYSVYVADPATSLRYFPLRTALLLSYGEINLRVNGTY